MDIYRKLVTSEQATCEKVAYHSDVAVQMASGKADIQKVSAEKDTTDRAAVKKPGAEKVAVVEVAPQKTDVKMPAIVKAAADEITSDHIQVELLDSVDNILNDEHLLLLNSKDLQQDTSFSTLQEVRVDSEKATKPSIA